MNVLFKKLQAGQKVYIKDDYEDIAIKIVPGINHENVFIRRKGRMQEREIDRTSKLVFDTELSGEEISKDEYTHY